MRAISILVLFLMSNILHAQQPVVNKVTAEICDLLGELETPLSSLSKSESERLIKIVLDANSRDWYKELDAYVENTGRSAYDFDQYLQHILQIDCKAFRVIDENLDRYMVDKKELRPLYLRAKEFITLLEDNSASELLNSFLSDDLKSPQTTLLLKSSMEQISIYKRTTTLNIMLVGTQNIRMRYFDYLTENPDFQIDLIFDNPSDLKIDKIEVKNKELLMTELKKRQELNKGIESGEIKLPPPPPKKKGGNGYGQY